MPIDVSGGDEVQAVGESFYRPALERITASTDGEVARGRVATLVPDPANPYDLNAVKVMIDEQQVAHLPRELAAVVSAQVAELTRAHGSVIVAAELRGSGVELGFGVILYLDLRKLGAVFEDEIEVEFESP